MNHNVHLDGVNTVILDWDCSVRTTLDHVCGFGHTRIACISGLTETSNVAERLEISRIFKKIHELHSDLVEGTPKYMVKEDHDECKRLLDRDDSFTAVLAANELTALGCIGALNGTGR